MSGVVREPATQKPAAMNGTIRPTDDHDLVPPLPQPPLPQPPPPPPSGDVGPTQVVDPDDVDGMLNEGGTREDPDAGRDARLDQP